MKTFYLFAPPFTALIVDWMVSTHTSNRGVLSEMEQLIFFFEGGKPFDVVGVILVFLGGLPRLFFGGRSEQYSDFILAGAATGNDSEAENRRFRRRCFSGTNVAPCVSHRLMFKISPLDTSKILTFDSRDDFNFLGFLAGFELLVQSESESTE